jgi:hypothetical protein
MTRRPLSPIRHCPICGIAMQASKSHEHLPAFDTFRCMTCDTVIRKLPPHTPSTDGPEPTGS